MDAPNNVWGPTALKVPGPPRVGGYPVPALRWSVVILTFIPAYARLIP